MPYALRCTWLIAALGWGLLTNVVNAADTESKWELEFGAGAAYAPDYSGSSGSNAQLRLWVDGALHTVGIGTFVIDSGSLTIDPQVRWDFIDLRTGGLGLLLGYRPGRSDSKSGYWNLNSGSVALRGLSNVNGAFDFGVQGYVAPFGLPLFVQVRSALRGKQGTLVNLGAYATLPLAADGELTLLPTITWANARQMRAFYGVDPTQSAASGFAAYNPGAGWQNFAFEAVGNWPITGQCHLIASVAYQRLIGNAAGSPLVETKNQVSGLIGLVWHL